MLLISCSAVFFGSEFCVLCMSSQYGAYLICWAEDDVDNE